MLLSALLFVSVFGQGDALPIETVRKLSYEHRDGRIPLRRITGTTALFFQSKLSCDVDGAPNAYHPVDDALSLDVIESAGGHRVGGASSGPLETPPSSDVVVYINGAPYIQPDGDYKGFYLSETSYQNSKLAETDPNRYLDPRAVHYIVLPDHLVPEAELGDLAIVYDPASGKHVAAVFGDIGPASESGEAALSTLQGLGMPARDGKSSPGQTRDDLFFLVFPHSGTKLEAAESWPHRQATIDQLAEAEFVGWGGLPKIEAILKQDPQGGSLPDNRSNRWIYNELAFMRAKQLSDPFDFVLPPRVTKGDPGRLPCAPEIVAAFGGFIDVCRGKIEDAEAGNGKPDALKELLPHLMRAIDVFKKFPIETVDELGPVDREVERAKGLADRIRQFHHD